MLTPDLTEQLYRCTRCGACLEVCPSYLASGDESLAARGRMSLLEAVADGRLGLTEGLQERLSRCLGCLACSQVCPSGLEVAQIIQAAKRGLAGARGSWKAARLAARRLTKAEGRLPAGVQLSVRVSASIRNAILRTAPGDSLLSHIDDGRLRTLPETAPRPLTELLPEFSLANGMPGHAATRRQGTTQRVAFFPGCATNLVFPETGLAAVAVLNRSGADVVMPRGLKCCGMPLLSLGDEDGAREMARENLRRLGSLDADAIVSPCPSCALALKEELPRLLGAELPEVRRLAAKITDIHQFLAQSGFAAKESPGVSDHIMKKLGKTSGNPSGNQVKVTWHDPCHLRYGLKVTAEPREIIASIPGVKYVESGEDQRCCGAGGVFSLLHYDLALKIGKTKAEEIAASGAELVATGCPACRMHLTDVLDRAGVQAKVVHTVDLI